MIIYIYRKCSTCQKALRFLEENHVSFICKEITQTLPSLQELHKMLKFQKGNVRKLFNTSGLLYKEMQLKEKLDEMPIDEALTLLSQRGMLVKRPFVIDDDFGLTGFNEKDWSRILIQP